MRVRSRLLVASLALLALSGPAESARRIALVIGNDAYQNLTALKKAVADAEGYAGVLTAKGFDQVILRTNVTRAAMDEAVAGFVEQIQPGDTAVFAYSGHGWSDGAQNFLIGIDAPLTGSQEFLARISIPLRNGSTGVIDDMERRGAALKVAIVDACRDNPFTPPAGTRSVGLSRGLVKIDPPEGTFVIFAAGAGQTSLDRLSDADPDPNSVFTRVFLPLIHADMTLQEATKQAQEKVTALARTISHKQQPAYYDEVLGKACLAGDCGGGATPEAVASQPNEAAAAYQAALAANSIEAWDAFLRYHQEGFYADLARSARKKLEPELAALPADPTPPQAGETPDADAGLVTECDRLAAIPLDPDKPPTLRAVGFPSGPAVAACREAIEKYPDVPRFKTQLAGALVSSKQDLAEARSLAEQSAAAGHAVAMLLLADIYGRGLGGPERTDEIGDLIRNAAAKGVPFGIFLLADAYENGGYKFEVNKEEAQRLLSELRSTLEAAMAAGDPDAYAALGMLYQEGRGVAADPVRAGDYLIEGLKRRSWMAIDAIRGQPDVLTADQRKTVEQILSDKGYSPGPIDGTIDDATKAALDAWDNAVDVAGK
jgi:TPR repeat protein